MLLDVLLFSFLTVTVKLHEHAEQGLSVKLSGPNFSGPTARSIHKLHIALSPFKVFFSSLRFIKY